MTYSATISTDNPAYIVLLIDDSGSMARPFGSVEAGISKAEYVGGAISRTIEELRASFPVYVGGAASRTLEALRATFAPEPCVHLELIGFGRGGSVAGTSSASNTMVSSSSSHLARDLAGYVAEPPGRAPRAPADRAGDGSLSINHPVELANGTPMRRALQYAQSMVRAWLDKHPGCFPPIVMNLTDGESTDGDPLTDADALKELHSSDGAVLLFNCHISSAQGAPILFPAGGSDLPDAHARLLFQMSSELPATCRVAASTIVGRQLPPGARGFTFQADMAAVSQFLRIGTSSVALVHLPVTSAPDQPANNSVVSTGGEGGQAARQDSTSPTHESLPDPGEQSLRALFLPAEAKSVDGPVSSGPIQATFVPAKSKSPRAEKKKGEES